MSYSSSASHGSRESERTHPVRVLIADDHPVVRQGLKMMLSADPEVVVVGEAKDGDEAFDMVHSLEWDVAVLDYSMPGRGGGDPPPAGKDRQPHPTAVGRST